MFIHLNYRTHIVPTLLLVSLLAGSLTHAESGHEPQRPPPPTAVAPITDTGNPPATLPYPCQARVRHRHPLQECRIIELREEKCLVEFQRPQRAVAPGQSVVFYREGVCLGGGVIDRGYD